MCRWVGGWAGVGGWVQVGGGGRGEGEGEVEGTESRGQADSGGTPRHGGSSFRRCAAHQWFLMLLSVRPGSSRAWAAHLLGFWRWHCSQQRTAPYGGASARRTATRSSPRQRHRRSARGAPPGARGPPRWCPGRQLPAPPPGVAGGSRASCCAPLPQAVAQVSKQQPPARLHSQARAGAGAAGAALPPTRMMTACSHSDQARPCTTPGASWLCQRRRQLFALRPATPAAILHHDLVPWEGGGGRDGGGRGPQRAAGGGARKFALKCSAADWTWLAPAATGWNPLGVPPPPPPHQVTRRGGGAGHCRTVHAHPLRTLIPGRHSGVPEWVQRRYKALGASSASSPSPSPRGRLPPLRASPATSFASAECHPPAAGAERGGLGRVSTFTPLAPVQRRASGRHAHGVAKLIAGTAHPPRGSKHPSCAARLAWRSSLRSSRRVHLIHLLRTGV